MRALLLALIAALAVVSLSGCSLPRVGDVAVGVDADGEPVLVMASCEGPADTIRVSGTAHADLEREAQHWFTVLDIENRDPRVDDPAAVSLANPDDRWTVIEQNGEFEEGVLYEADAWPAGDDAYLGSVEFDLARLEAIGAGEVLDQGPQGDRVRPVAEFIDEALTECRSS